MTQEQWKILGDYDGTKKSPASEAYRKAYCDFMYNENNVGNCEECPHGSETWNQYGRPCGQQHCWVAAHCGLIK